MSSVQAKRITYEKYLKLPETKQRYDIVDGVMQMAPAPTPDHQWIMIELLVRLRSFVNEQRSGVVFAAPVDLLIQREPLRTRQPDILYLNAERTGIQGRADLAGLQFFEIPPDLVVEVLSPSNTRSEIEGKLEDYLRIGVLECWLVSPEAETIEVLRLSAGEATTDAIFGVDGTLLSNVLGGFSLPIREIFRPA